MGKFTGKSMDQNCFQFVEKNELNMEDMFAVLSGQKAGHIARKAIDDSVCEKVEQNFWDSPARKERPDKIPAHFIGTYHYGKSLETYFKEVEHYKTHLRSLFDGTENIIENVTSKFREFLKAKGIEFRLAQQNSKEASAFRIASFPQVAPYAVLPHDDIAQLGDPDQLGYEIQKVNDYDVVTINFCIDNALADKDEENSGRFMYWNIQPNDNDRDKMDVSHRGYPYPPEYLEGYEKIEFPVRKGDIFMLNGRNAHAVGPVQGDGTNRVTMQFFMGFIDPKTVVYWV